MRYLVLLVCVLMLFPLATARDLYVDNSCATGGTGLTTTCGADGPFNDLQDAFDALQAGDTLYIMQGTGQYVTTNTGTSPRFNGGFSLQGKQGTPENPIRITYYPGHNPLLVSCGVNNHEVYCPHPTITASRASHIIFDGIRVQGGLSLANSMAAVHNHRDLSVINSDISVGWAPYHPDIDTADGNWATLFLQGFTTAYVANNTLHSLNVPPDGGDQSSTTYVMMFGIRDVTIEYNDMHPTQTELGPGGPFDKGSVDGLTIRRNHIRGVRTGYRMGGQDYQEIDTRMQNTLYTENLIDCDSSPVLNSAIEFGNRGTNRSATHNTGIGCRVGVAVGSHGHENYDRALYNNLFVDVGLKNTVWYNDDALGPREGQDIWDFNVYTPGGQFRIHNSQNQRIATTFEEYQELGYEPNSQVLDCDVGSDGRFPPSSPCQTAGRVGGVSSGAVVPVGAFAFTDCLGRGCPDADWSRPELFLLSDVPPTRPGDFNNDGHVGLYDLLFVVNRLGTSQGDSLFDARADMNDDGVIDLFDLVLVARLVGT